MKSPNFDSSTQSNEDFGKRYDNVQGVVGLDAFHKLVQQIEEGGDAAAVFDTFLTNLHGGNKG